MRTKPSISIIGAGNVGFHLATALHDSGFQLKHISSRSREKAAEIAALTSAKVTGLPVSAEDHPDIWLICVNDDAIPNIAETLEKSALESQAVVVHTSGSTHISSLGSAGDRAGVLYPVQTFSRNLQMEYTRIPFLLEAAGSRTMDLLEQLAEGISGKWHHADSEARLAVHIAAVFACNFGNHMSAVAEKLLREHRLNFELIRPLVNQTFSKLQTLSPRDAQTGPALRTDINTIEKHLEMLAGDKELRDMYKALTMSIQRFSKEN